MKIRSIRMPCSRRPSAKMPVVALAVLALAGAHPGSSAAAAGTSGAQRGSVLLSGSPGVPVANPRTNTVYVPIQCAANFCSTPAAGHAMDVIDAARCNAEVVSGCRVLATVRVGKNPLAAVLDPPTDTIYVINGSGSVSVVNGARCNAAAKSGCRRPVATVTTGGFTVAGAVDPATRTLYVANLKGAVFAIDIARCDAITTNGCRQPVRKIIDRPGPDAIDVDIATDTVYAADGGASGNGDTLSVIDGAQCNGSVGSGCDRAPRTVRVGTNPYWDAVDQATNTVYVANDNEGTVSVINGARCNATVTTGCKRLPTTVSTGGGAGFVAVDEPQHTAFVGNSVDDTLSAINTKQCSGTHTAGCPKLAPAQQASSNQGPGYAQFPTQFALIPRTSSAYLLNVGGSNVLAVVDLSRCDAVNTSACRVDAPSVPQDHEYLAAIDPTTNTIYASNTTKPRIDVLNGATCRAGQLSGCTPVAEIPIDEPAAQVGAVDDTTSHAVRVRRQVDLGDQHRDLQRRGHDRVQQPAGDDPYRSVSRDPRAEPRNPDAVRGVRQDRKQGRRDQRGHLQRPHNDRLRTDPRDRERRRRHQPARGQHRNQHYLRTRGRTQLLREHCRRDQRRNLRRHRARRLRPARRHRESRGRP